MESNSQPTAELVSTVRHGFIALTKPKGDTFWLNADHITLIEQCDPERGQARARVAVTGGLQRYCLETADEVMARVASTYEI
jgi:uncharacterized protein YlzI (FlbEa/FlbD family)